MSTTTRGPLTDDELVAVLRAEGVKLREWPGWRSHNRNGQGRAWGGPQCLGVVNHHTGSDTQGDPYIRNILWSGYAGLPGPLCQFGVDMSGTAHLISNGRANHAGGGCPQLLANLRVGGRRVEYLMDREHDPTRGNTGGADGNRWFYGIEYMYDGGQELTAAAEDTGVRINAAILRALGLPAPHSIGHREWSADKIDPGAEHMPTFRAKVAARLRTDPARPAPATNPKEWDEMATKKEIRAEIDAAINDKLDEIASRAGKAAADAVWAQRSKEYYDENGNKVADMRTRGHVMDRVHERAMTINAKVDRLIKKLGA